MKKKKLISKTFIVFSLFCSLLYLVFFPNRILKESLVRIKDTIHVPDIPTLNPEIESQNREIEPAVEKKQEKEIPRNQTAAFPFLLSSEENSIFGYIGEDNTILYQEKKEYGITLSPRGFINYSSVPQDLVRKDIYGENPLSISGPGYPLFGAGGKRLFIITSDCTSLREINNQGVTLWRRSVPSWITSFSVNEDYALIGLSSGQFLLIGKTGETISGGRINESGILCIYGTAIQDDGKLFAILSGIDPLFLALYNTETSEEVFRTVIDDPARTERRMLFSSDDRFLFFEKEESIVCFDIKTKTDFSVNLPGKLLDMYYHETQQLLHLLCNNGEMKELLIIHPPDTVVFRTKFHSTSRFLDSQNNRIYTGKNKDIVSYTMEDK